MKMKSLVLSTLFCVMFNFTAAHNDPVEEVFTHIYKTKFWQLGDSVSGPGSELRFTEKARNGIRDLIKRFGIKSIADAPCGDLNWMRHVDIGECTYTGYDIVQDLIERNIRFFGETRSFKHFNLIESVIEKVDLIICRDMLAHLTHEQIFKVLRNFKKSGSKYILMTTGLTTVDNSPDITPGEVRRINFERAPFNFPRPLALIEENVPFECERGKHLALWFLDDLNI
ncbi:MAG TPA: class I SAM-dependent methyltransferase [Candidatus Babeliales bacterium]|nr:class I SAM-dependent methyltransferase [Candidatus Babeliales bacterium]